MTTFTASLLYQTNLHAAPIYALYNGLEHNTILSASSDKFCAAWSLHTLQPEIFSIKAEAAIYALTTNTQNGCIYLATNKGDIYSIDYFKKIELKHLLLGSAIFSILYSSAYNVIVATTDNGLLYFIDATSYAFKKTLTLSNQKIRKAIILQNCIYAVCNDGFLYVISLLDFSLLQKHFVANMGLTAIAYNTYTNQLIIGAKDAHLYFLAVDTFQILDKVPAHNYAIYDIKVCNEKALFATASRDKHIKLWNANDNSFLLRISQSDHKGHTHSVNALMWHGNKLLSAGDDRYIKMWNIELNN